MTHVMPLIDAARLALTLLKDLKNGGADNPEFDILKRALNPFENADTDDNIARSAQRARAIAGLSASLSGDCDPAAAVSDLISDLGHFCDADDIDFLTRVRIGIRDWLAEKEIYGDPEQTDIIRSVDIGIGPPGSCCPAVSAHAHRNVRR